MSRTRAVNISGVQTVCTSALPPPALSPVQTPRAAASLGTSTPAAQSAEQETTPPGIA